MNTAERAARRYCRKVRSWLPGGKMRRYVMTQIRETVQEFVQEHPDADVAAIQAQLGTPQEIAAAYGNCSGSEGPSHPEACAVRGLRHNAGHSDFLDGSGHC